MGRRVRGNSHARCYPGEKMEITSKSYLSEPEAICAGFYGTDPDAMGKRIADLIKNSSGHWSYISSSEYSYIGVGVEYREGSEYGWYCCVMVGSVNYG